jgi:hypothetical protein
VTGFVVGLRNPGLININMAPAKSSPLAMLALAVAAAAQGGWAPAQCAGPLALRANGSSATWQVVTSAGARGVAADGASLRIAHNDRAYIVRDCADGGNFSAAMFAGAWSLVGSVVNFTVDLSTAGCGCNAAFYLVAMPATDDNGQPTSGEGDGYCDANDVGHEWCPEMDILEANTAALAVTPHRCDAPVNGHYANCDKGGCSVNPHKTGPTLFGPGAGFTVNSLQPFSVATAFARDPSTGLLASITTTIAQGGSASFVLSHTDATCGAGYLEAMSAPLAAGMVPAISVWGDAGSTMSWLDVPPCDVATSCADASAGAIFSAFSIEALP